MLFKNMLFIQFISEVFLGIIYSRNLRTTSKSNGVINFTRFKSNTRYSFGGSNGIDGGINGLLRMKLMEMIDNKKGEE